MASNTISRPKIWGKNRPYNEVRVYDQGTVVWMKRISYQDLATSDLPKAEHEKALRGLMEKTLMTVGAAIAKGKIG